MQVGKEIVEGVTVLRPVVEYLDASNAPRFRDAARTLIGTSRRVAIDLGAVKFLDSAGLGALLQTLRAVQGQEGRMALFGLSAPVRSTLYLVRMQRVIDILNDMDEVLTTMAERDSAQDAA